MKQKKKVSLKVYIVSFFLTALFILVGIQEEQKSTTTSTGEVVQAQEQELKEELEQVEATTGLEGFRSATGNMYVGTTLYVEEEGTMVEALKILQTKDRQILVKDIATGEQFWKDRDEMIKAERREYGLKYYVKEE